MAWESCVPPHKHCNGIEFTTAVVRAELTDCTMASILAIEERYNFYPIEKVEY